MFSILSTFLVRAMALTGMVVLAAGGVGLGAQIRQWVRPGHYKAIAPARQAERVQRTLEADRTRIVLVPARPSIARLELIDAVKGVSARLEVLAADHEWTYFVDVLPVLLGSDAMPRADLLGEDKHHLNDTGFDVLTAATRPVVAQAEAAYWKGRQRPGGR